MSVNFQLNCDQAFFFLFSDGGQEKRKKKKKKKERQIQLLHESSAASPDSGRLSNWSKNKDSLSHVPNG